ncbi:hypothetical protein, partial [Kribbella monticola]|uniref:hypothetical protein n=1 Tax=Kribbella monticola TaxID=2185285 RepID=UPI0013008655
MASIEEDLLRDLYKIFRKLTARLLRNRQTRPSSRDRELRVLIEEFRNMLQEHQEANRIYQALSPEERQQVRERLARQMQEDLDRGRTDDLDPDVRREVDELNADRDGDRGDPDDAARRDAEAEAEANRTDLNRDGVDDVENQRDATEDRENERDDQAVDEEREEVDEQERDETEESREEESSNEREDEERAEQDPERDGPSVVPAAAAGAAAGVAAEELAEEVREAQENESDGGGLDVPEDKPWLESDRMDGNLREEDRIDTAQPQAQPDQSQPGQQADQPGQEADQQGQQAEQPEQEQDGQGPLVAEDGAVEPVIGAENEPERQAEQEALEQDGQGPVVAEDGSVQP